MKRVIALLLALLLFLSPTVGWAQPTEEIYSIIERYYVDEVDIEALRTVAPDDIGNFLGDSYTTYFSPEDFEAFLDSYFGVYCGIGAVIANRDGETYIQSIFPESPAERAGLMPGDVFVAVDGVDVIGMPMEMVSTLIRGEEGTVVQLFIRRGSVNFTRYIVRELIELPSLASCMLGDVAYLAIYNFSEQTPASFKNHLLELQKNNPRGYILDLCDNPGGSLAAVLKIADMILPAGKRVWLRTRYEEDSYENNIDGTLLENLVVLVDNGSASASEILAGAIQDYAVGLLVGEQTFGKASVQILFRLSDGSGLKVTTARYYTPNQQDINKIGLTPDIEVIPYEDKLQTALRHIRSTSPTIVFPIGETDVWSTQGEFFMESPPFLEEGRSYVPLRLLAETMGAEVLWDSETSTAALSRDGEEIIILVGESTGFKDGKPFDLLGRAVIREGRIFVPARAIAEALDARVWWDGIRQEVVIDW